MIGGSKHFKWAARCGGIVLAGLISLLGGSAPAQQREFPISDTTFTLRDVTTNVAVYFQGMRFVRTTPAVWNVEASITNTSGQTLPGPLVLVIESFTGTTGPLQTDGTVVGDPAWPFYDFSAQIPGGALGPGQRSAARTLTLGHLAGQSPSIQTRVFALAPGPAAPAAALVQSLDADGQPLPAVRVEETGPEGAGERRTDVEQGFATVGRGAGLNLIKFSATNHLPVWRRVVLSSGSLVELPGPRLTRRSSAPINITPLAGGTLTGGGVGLVFPPGSVMQPVTATLTPLHAQSLPLFLPPGWSPLQAFWLELSGELASPASLTLQPWGLIRTNETAVLARLNEATVTWEAVQTIAGAGTGPVVLSVLQPGAYALVLPDAPPHQPPLPGPGEPLGAGPLAVPDLAGLTAAGVIQPAAAAASTNAADVTAWGEVVFDLPGGPLPSGVTFQGEQAELYRLSDGREVRPPRHRVALTAYQRPGDNEVHTLHARFPVRPGLLLGPETLLEGEVRLEVERPGAFAGALLDPAGGQVVADGLRVLAGVGDLPSAQAVRLRRVAATQVAPLLTEGLQLAAAFDLAVGEVTPGRSLRLQLSGLPTNALFVLARVLARDGLQGLEPVQRLRTDATGALQSLEPATPPRLPGLDRSGRYALVRVPAAQGLVRGIAVNASGQPVAGRAVRLSGLPWLTFSALDGAYQLVAPVGAVEAILADAAGNDTAQAAGVVADAGAGLVLNVGTQPIAPQVVAVTPTNGAVAVPRVTAVTVTFNKPVQPATVLGGGLGLLDAATNVVPAAITLNARGTVATLLPAEPLAGLAAHRVLVSTNIRDTAGLALVAPVETTFTTEPDNFQRGAGGQLTSYEPTNGLARLEGGPGFAEPQSPVVLVNQTSGRTTTVLARPDGSFTGSIEAAVDDELAVTVANANGTRNTIAVSRQVFADGSVALFSGGGTLTVPGENGPIDFIVEPGAIGAKTKFKLEPVTLAETLTVLSNTQPEGGRVLGGVKFSPIEGSPLTRSLDVSFPVRVEDMQLPPGESPSNCIFGLAIAREVDGVTAFELVDRMHYENGRLVTHSPPFFGLLGPYEQILVTPLLMAVSGTPLVVHGRVFAARYVEVDGQILNVDESSIVALGGALVRVRPASTSGGLPGTVQAGSVFAVSGPDGRYTALVNTQPSNPSRAVGVSATHPRFPGLVADRPLPDVDPATLVTLGGVLFPHNVVFPLSQVASRLPPSISLFHTPERPAVNAAATLTVVATDSDAVTQITVVPSAALSLVPGVTATLGDVEINSLGTEPVGETGLRARYEVLCRKTAQVQLAITARDSEGNSASAAYAIVFGQPEVTATNNPPVADVNDRTGPSVLGTRPAAGSASLVPGQPLEVTFDEPISRAVLQEAGVVSVSPPAGAVTLDLSPDQLTLRVFLNGLQPDTAYTATFGTAIKDLNGNRLDADPATPGNQPFLFPFRTAPVPLAVLPGLGLDAGAGAAIHGNYAYVIERRDQQRGRLAVYDLGNPRAPQAVGEYSLPPFPRDLVFIPQYSFAWTNGAPGTITTNSFTNVLTRPLVAVVGGLVGEGTFQWLRVLDVSNPSAPSLVAGRALNFSGLTTASRLRWNAPVLAYLENAGPDSISLVNLQELIIATTLPPAEYLKLPPNGRPGLDLNGDGDYVDEGELLPLPARFPIDFGGKVAAFGLTETSQGIVDFDVGLGGAFLGVIADAGFVLGNDGLPTATPAPPAYRTLFDGATALDREAASFVFPPSLGLPRRVTMVFQWPLVVSNQLANYDLALVSVRTPSAEPANLLVVLDVNDRLAPRELARVPLPKSAPNEGLYSTVLRPDGTALVAGETNAFIVDLTRLGRPPAPDGSHPALVGILPGVGGSARSFGSLPSGLHISARVDGRATLVQTAPRMQFVAFPSQAPFAPSTLAQQPESAVAALLAGRVAPEFLPPAAKQTVPGLITSGLTPPSPTRHFYVLIEAPGGAGPVLDLALESLNAAGVPLRKRGLLFPPVHALGAATLTELGQTPGEGDAPVRPGRAWRLSNDPASPHYNLYLSRPVALVNDEFSVAELAALDAALSRDLLWSGHALRAALDPLMRTNPVVGAFAATVDAVTGTLRPGIETTAPSFPADYLPSPNPGPVAGGAPVPFLLNALQPHNSELQHDATDLVLPGRRLPLEFRRHYGGQGLFDGPFGRGWDFNFNQRVVEVPAGALAAGEQLPLVVRDTVADSETAGAGDLLFHTGAGRIIAYRDAGATPPPEIAADPLIQQLGWLPRAARFYLPPPGLFSPMIKFQDGRYVRLDPDGKQTWFDARGRLTRLYDRYEQNFIELFYNARGQLIRIHDDVGRPLDIGYYRQANDPSFRAGVDLTPPAGSLAARLAVLGRIARLRDYSGRDVRFHYTADGLLERRESVDVQTAPPGGFRGRAVTYYDYSPATNPGRTARSLVAVRGMEPGGAAVLAVRSFANRGRDTVGALAIGGLETTVEQTHTNTAAALAAGNGGVRFTSPDNTVAELGFDRFGRVTRSVFTGPRGPAETNRTEYYANGLVAAIVRPLGGRTEFFYDTNNPSLRSRGNLVRTRKVPDARGGPVLEATAQFSPFYNLHEGAVTDFRGVTSLVTLAPDKRDVFRVQKGGEREEFSVNAFGQLERHTSVDNIVNETLYNTGGFLQYHRVGPHQSTFSYAPIAGGASDSGLRGRPSSVADPEQNVTEFLHDELDRLVGVRRAGAQTTIAYDAAGNRLYTLAQVETNRALIERFHYDALGFLTSNVVENVEAGDGVTNLVTAFEPDEFRRVRRVVFPGGEEQRFTYDHAGRLVRFERVGAQTNHFTYDANGNLITARIGGAEERYFYDGHDRLVGVGLANGSTVALTLDGNGNTLARATYDAGSNLLQRVEYEYDDLNRVRRVARQRDNGVAETRTDFNTAARAVIVTDAMTNTATTTLDAAGRPAILETATYRQELTHDGNGNLLRRDTLEEGDLFREVREFNARNQLVRLEDNLGLENRFSPDLDGRLRAQTDKRGLPTRFEHTLMGEVARTERPNGVRSSQQFNAQRQTIAVADARTNTLQFVFDEAGRLESALLPDGEVSASGDYDEFFNPRTNALPRGVRVRSDYDFEGKLTNRVHTLAGQPDHTQTYDYDGLRRFRRVANNHGSVEFHYDLGGWVKRQDFRLQFGAPAAPDLLAAVTQDTYLNDFRRELGYPSANLRLIFGRDATGRLLSLTPSAGAPVIQSSQWRGEVRLEQRVLGNGLIREERAHDGLRRVVGRRYVRVSDGAVLADVRHHLDPNGAIVARQEVHRGGRADLYRYDAGQRLTRWDAGARPAAAVVPRPFEGFSPDASLPGAWAPGLFAKEYGYDAADHFTTNRLLAPAGAPDWAPTATNFTGLDPLLFATNVNGFVRARDAAGNVTRALLAVRLPGQAAPAFVPATLAYDALGRLTRVTRDDGVVVTHEYGPLGLRTRRTVTGPPGLCVPSDLAFLYDGINLIEERDLADNARLVRRYYYADEGDELIAADLDVAGTLRRHYYLTDNVRSVMALADDAGQVVERVRYDAWGQPRIETPDTAAPQVSFLRLETNGLTVVFTEPVLAAPVVPTNGAALVTNFAALDGLLEIRVGGSPVAGTVRFDDGESGAAAGAAVRFETAGALSGALEVRVAGGGVRDEWGRTNLAQQFNVTASGPAGTILLTNAPAGSTAPAPVARSLAGSPFLFHGQYFDADTGLYYLRARFYDPLTGLFLQRDPAGYADGVNHYAGFANNPVNLRDPTGAATDELGRQLEELGSQASIKQDGLSGYLVGRALTAVGTVLQLGTKAAEGEELLNSRAPGTVGLLDRMRGAELVVQDMETAKAGYGHLKKGMALGATALSRAQGLLSAVRNRSNPVWDKLRSEGLADFEIEGYLNAVQRYKKEMGARSVEVAIRSFGEKAQPRRERATKGMSQKPTRVKAKTDDFAQIEWQISERDVKGNIFVRNKEFVSDTDLYYIKVDGRTVSLAEASRFQVVVALEQARAFRRRGYTGVPNVGVLHGPHVNMPELVGTGRLKPGGNPLQEWDVIANPDPQKAVGGPGAAAFAIRLDGAGHVTAFNPSPTRLRGIVMESLQKFRASPVARQNELYDLGPRWFQGFNNDLPETSVRWWQLDP